jgi:metal-sulfur cluster biosynthetic enzyme
MLRNNRLGSGSDRIPVNLVDNNRCRMNLQSVELKHAITERLGQVIDPETGVDVVRMRLVEDLRVDGDTGRVAYRFRPSSPLCPLAVHLALDIRRAVASVQGVTEQEIEVVGYVGSDELNALLKEEM